MPSGRAQVSGFGSGWETLSALVAADGTLTHGLSRRLGEGTPSMRDLADAVHHIAILHGRFPGVVDLTAEHLHDGSAREWFERSTRQFAEERSYLVHLVAAVGPLPSTPGQPETEAAVAAQQHALDMLGRSDRNGCAIGASVALALDWPAIRMMLDRAAERVGVTPPTFDLPERYETAAMVSAISGDMPVERAIGFGAQQLLAQHRGLCDLLEARASARDSQ